MDARLTPLILVLLACVGVVAVRAASTPAGTVRNIVIFGDSLTAGYGLANPPEDSFPAVLQRKIDAERPGYRVINAGLSGETSAAGLRRVDWILRQPADIFVLALGANDGLRGLDPVQTKANLAAILTRVQAKYPQARLVVTGMAMPPERGADYARAFGEIFPAVAAQFHAELVPFLLEGVGGVSELNQHDGIHPNPKGHLLVAENVWKILRPML